MISAVIAAAGSGRRMGCKKQFIELLGAPVISYTLSVFERSEVDEIIVVTAEEDIEKMRKIADKYGISKLRAIVPGGAERSDSVMAGLSCVMGETVLIHDGARPFVKTEEISEAISAAEKYGAACLGYPVKDTIKITDGSGTVVSTPERSRLFAAATPQAFRTELIKSAYAKVKESGAFVTDDSSAAEFAGETVKVIPCSYENIKITTPEDLPAAEAILKRRGQV